MCGIAGAMIVASSISMKKADDVMSAISSIRVGDLPEGGAPCWRGDDTDGEEGMLVCFVPLWLSSPA